MSDFFNSPDFGSQRQRQKSIEQQKRLARQKANDTLYGTNPNRVRQLKEQLARLEKLETGTTRLARLYQSLIPETRDNEIQERGAWTEGFKSIQRY